MKKRNVIKKYQEYKEIINLRNFKRNQLFVIYYREGKENYTRIGLLVGKRNGNAVVRNKIKRQVRSIIDSKIDYSKNIDIIVIISQSYDVNKFLNNKEMLENLLDSIYFTETKR